MRIVLLIAIACISTAFGQNIELGLLKYSGGGDWYANLETSLPNLVRFSNQNLGTSINGEQRIVEAGDPELFELPFVHMTGHGNVVFNEAERENLRLYLLGGGFLHIDDNYGMDPYIRAEMKRVFPELDWVELPYSHPIYHQTFEFNSGPPKVHEHDNGRPQGLALMHEGRVMVYYTYEVDLGDGWESPNVHNDPAEVRQKALQMGANMIEYVFNGEAD